MKLRQDQDIVHMVDVKLESVREVLAALLSQMGLVIVRSSGHDYEEFEVFPRNEIEP